MSRKLPPLNGLRAFECAARHMSFTLASQELNVTQAAVSHQVKSLENHLGVLLFKRLTRKLVLTEAGQNLMPEIREAFDRIGTAVDGIRQDEINERLTVRLGPSLAARWLSPRLKQFWQQFPKVDLCLFHSNSPVNFDREDIDLAITYGKGDWPGVLSSRLHDSDYFPVCSPGLIEAFGGKISISDLNQITLLHDARYEVWEQWLQLTDQAGVNARRGVLIDDTNVLMQAALDGQGMAMGSTLFVQRYMASGRLVRPFDLSLSSENAYYIVCPKNHLQRQVVSDFKHWLLAQGSMDETENPIT